MQPLNGKKTKFKNNSWVRHQRSEGMSRRSNGTNNLQGKKGQK